jgi:uncharacterized glyoxalase superfamily protein PhnB
MSAFDQLRMDDSVPARPDPRFARSLRASIEAALAPDVDLPTRKDITMTTRTADTDAAGSTVAAPAARQVITPYLAVHDGAGALAWYTDALGARELSRYTGDDGRIGHAELEIHGARVFLSDAYPEIGVVAATDQEGSSTSMHLEVPDVDAAYASAIERGAVGVREPADQPHGARNGTILDPFGHRWMLSQQVASPTLTEIDAATPGFSVTGSGEAATAPAVGDRPIQLGYFTIHTGDIERAAAFYSQLFGWDVDPQSGHVGNCDLPFGFENRPGRDGYRLWMKVIDPEPVLARLLELGGEVVSDEEYASGRAIECLDDQGNRFDLHRPAPGYE